MKARIDDSALPAFEAERDQYVPRELARAGRPIFLQTHVLVIEFELPGAVQVQPLGSLKLGLRILGSRDLLRWQRAPGGNEQNQ